MILIPLVLWLKTPSVDAAPSGVAEAPLGCQSPIPLSEGSAKDLMRSQEAPAGSEEVAGGEEE